MIAEWLHSFSNFEFSFNCESSWSSWGDIGKGLQFNGWWN